MGPNFIPAVIVGVGTFFFSTQLQGVEPRLAFVASVVFSLVYWLGSDFMDDVVS